MNTLNRAEQTTVISALIEGNSIRSIERMTRIHRDTIMRLTLKVGAGCARLLDSKLRNIKANRIQVDEIWTYVFKKQARLMSDSRSMGDQYVFIGMDADTKLVISHLVGKRQRTPAERHRVENGFIADLKDCGPITQIATSIRAKQRVRSSAWPSHVPAHPDS